MAAQPRYPGIRITTNGNQLVSYHTEARITQGGVFYPITPSTEMGEQYQLAFAEGKLDVFGGSKIAIETEGEHAAQGGAIALSVTGKRVVNFTSGQGLVYGLEQYYHAPGKLSTMVVEVAARALTKHALNVHCGHDDIYAVLDTGWIILFGKDAQQAADQALILRRVTERCLTPGINTQDGFLTSHLERTFFKHEAELLREFLGHADDEIECPTEAQRVLFGPTRRRVPAIIDLANPMLLGPVQNQEHYMNGVVARRDNFAEDIMGCLEESYAEFAKLTGRAYGMLTEHECADADTVFLSLGSAAENVDAAVDYLRANEKAKVGSIHLNVLRPFPEAAVAKALKGKRNVIILERTDECLSGDNPLTREIRSVLSKTLENTKANAHAHLPLIAQDDQPRIFSGVYGLGSRDFRPEGILGAYEYAMGDGCRRDGKSAADGQSFFVIGIDHPYAVISERTPSLLPEGAIAVRLHSVGGWGMITTGKNLGEVIGALGDDLAKSSGEVDAFGRPVEVLHISANPKYGSEKKGAPTSYFMVAAKERVRVNCDLRHVNVVLCCDPKAFTHTNPLDGMAPGGTFVWESSESPEMAWQRIPRAYRQEIIDKKIRIYTLPGFEIAKRATDRPELQLRMQGNAFLGAFFRVSGFLEKYGVDQERYREVVLAQYEKKFGRFGAAVVQSNMTVMEEGYELVQEVPHGELDAPDGSSMRGEPTLPCDSCGSSDDCEVHELAERIPMARTEVFDREYRAGLGYHQPASTLSSVGVMAAATGATASKYVARRETPQWIAENCTQCMECIESCPDTALPNTAQDLGVVLSSAVKNYVADEAARTLLLSELPSIEERLRERMRQTVKAKQRTPFVELLRLELDAMGQVHADARQALLTFFERTPFAFQKVPLIFGSLERKNEGAGGLFGIFVSDLCKGCGECVTECGENEALVMRLETEELNADHETGTTFLDLLPDTPQKYLGRYDPENPAESHQATLRNHLMQREKYEALVSGDGACAGCGEKSVLRAAVTLTEAYMRPLFHAKAERLLEKATRLEQEGVQLLESLESRDPKAAAVYSRLVAHLLLGLGGEDDADTDARIEAAGLPTKQEVIASVVAVMLQDAHNHRHIRTVDGRHSNGMSVMAMGAHTGCNTVFGSTPPNNPHPYPWMNSLFQDGTTITWLFGESFIMDHARRSVLPERLADILLDAQDDRLDEAGYFGLTHLTDSSMSDLEIRELPKAWAVGGDGGMGDIGFQNVSKVVLQNRPNVKILMLDTQVYSNTGGQNSDSTPMLGGGDMNQLGAASQGKFTEKKSLSEIFTSGHGSPFVAQVSMANSGGLYKALLKGLEYRGTAFYQCYTPCQPEHGVADNLSTRQARLSRDSRAVPEFVFEPYLGETYGEAMSLKGNPNVSRDWAEPKAWDGTRYRYTVAHWAATEARFRRHLKPLKEADDSHVDLFEMLLRITQADVVGRRFFDPTHRSFIPDFKVTIDVEQPGGSWRRMALSRQMVIFCVERRRAWRMLQSKAGVENPDYIAQRDLLARIDKGEIDASELIARGSELLQEPQKA